MLSDAPKPDKKNSVKLGQGKEIISHMACVGIKSIPSGNHLAIFAFLL
jgi:hypothetical protein